MKAFCAVAALLCWSWVTTNVTAGSIADYPARHALPRIITLAPHVTETIFAAGAGDGIIATVDSSNFPDQARSIPRIGDGLNVNVEQILAKRPDILIAWQPSALTRALDEVIKSLPVSLIFSDPKTLADIPTEIRRYGALLGTSAVANEHAAELESRLLDLERRYAGRKPLKVFIEIGDNPLYTLGRAPLFNDMIRVCSGVNLYSSAHIAAPHANVEEVLMMRPDVIVVATHHPEMLDRARQRWARAHLPAALNSHIYGIDADLLSRPGPRLIDASQALCDSLDQARQDLPATTEKPLTSAK
jgi:vitamin B12 transport system substrate-binding protein